MTVRRRREARAQALPEVNQAEIGFNSNTWLSFTASVMSPLRNANGRYRAFGILHGKIRRPTGVIFDEFNRDLGRVAAFVNEFDGLPDYCVFHRITKRLSCAVMQSIVPPKGTSESGGNTLRYFALRARRLELVTGERRERKATIT